MVRPLAPRHNLPMQLRLPQGQYYGRVDGTWTREGLGLYEVAYAPQLKMARHAHELSRCILVLSGSVRHCSTRDVDCTRQSVVFVAGDETHEDAVGGSGAQCFIVEFGTEWLRRMAAHRPEGDHLSFAGHHGLSAGILSRIRYECRHSDDVSHLIVDGLLLEVLGHARRSNSRQIAAAPAWLRSVVELLRDRFRERLTITEVATQANVHPVHLCREFRRHTGSTVGTYLRQLRIDYVCSALARTNRSIAEIALEAGFANQSHLSATFRRVTNLSPKAYRDLARVR